jgi:ferredoxin-NADP reductase
LPPRKPLFSGAPPSLEPALFARIQSCFAALARPESGTDARKLERSLDLRNRFVAERALSVFERDPHGLVDRFELVRGVPRLFFRNALDKLEFAFRLHDLDADGVIDRAELACVLQLGLSEYGFVPEPRLVEHFRDLLLAASKGNRDGRLSLRAFEAIASHGGEWALIVPRGGLSRLSPNHDVPVQPELGPSPELAPRPRVSADPAARPSLLLRVLRFVQSHPALVLLVAVWALGNVALFVHAVLKYQALGKNPFVQIARGCGACINLNGALIALPMARRTLTWARRLPGLRLLPLDNPTAIHRTLGMFLLALSLVHTAAHCVSWASRQPGLWVSLMGGTAGLTGLALMLVFAVMWFFSRSKVRASKRFEVFARTHLLYPLWFGLALAHGPAFWKWASVPLAIFAVDRLLRLQRSSAPTSVQGLVPLLPGVTRLTIEKPANFVHQAGDYLFLKVPAVAPNEWHPFTISSAPEQAHLTVHVRTLGDFTGALYDFARARTAEPSPPELEVCLDGPFSTASQRIFHCRHAVLIGGGIGVTPFASVLESIVLKRAADVPFEKVYFYWLNRDLSAFKWFAELLATLERGVAKKLVEVRMFMTGSPETLSPGRANPAQGGANEVGEYDEFLRSMTQWGAPDWRTELSKIALDHPDTAQVFFCGPEGLARSLRALCAELGLPFRQEHF